MPLIEKSCGSSAASDIKLNSTQCMYIKRMKPMTWGQHYDLHFVSHNQGCKNIFGDFVNKIKTPWSLGFYFMYILICLPKAYFECII